MPSSVQPDFGGRPGGSPHAHLFHEKVRLSDPKGTAKRVLGYLGGRKAALALVFLCATVTTAIAIAATRLNGYAVDGFIKTGDLRGLGLVCALMLGMYAVNALSTYAQNALMIAAAQRSSADIRRDLFVNMQKLPLKYFDTHPSGDLMSRLTNDVDNINLMLAQGVVQLFSGIISVAGMLAAMLVLSPLLTAIGLSLTPLMFLGTRFIARKAQPYFVAQQKELGNLNGYIEETISGQKTIALFAQGEKAQADFAKINARFVQAAVKAQGLSGTMGPISNMVNNATYAIVTVCGALLVIGGTGVTVGVVFSFILYMRGFTRPINDILNLFNTIQSALAGAERVFEVIDEPKESDREGARDAAEIAGDVAIEDLSFSYVPGKPVLKGARLSARRGQTVAIVGPTGAGKTTIINLLTKFYDFEGGSILIDGRDIRDITARSLRERVSIVLQDPFLFSESVRENIRYGRLSATDAEVEEAARRSRAHEFILQLPDGYDTVLSDNGGNLSQGQRQLLSIARAVIARSSILILDEATSSIDTRTEALIQEALLGLMKGKTCFVIAHRLSTIRKADKIVVISDGRSVESGTHEELIARGGFYAELYESQFSTGMAP
jgi:ATP-binding cassette, subfamily B, multidrug efflux pump